MPREVQETRSSGQYDPCGEQGRRTTPEGIPDNGEHGHGPKIATVERREASVSFSGGNARRLNQAPACRSWHANPGCPRRHPLRPSALPTPSIGVENEEMFGARRRRKGEGRG